MTYGALPNLVNVSVILVEPATPGNIGSTARAMKTMGLSDLVVVNGVKFKGTVQAAMMGHGAGDLLDSARELPTWEEATAGIHWLVGTTHRKRRAQYPQMIPAREAAVKVASLSEKHRVGLVFGREETGLTDAELRKCHDIASVAQSAEHPSLNLSQAVMIFAYEVFLASLGEVARQHYNLATVHEVESMLQHMATSLAKVGFVPHQGNPDTFLRALRRVISRAPLEKRDVNVLHRICQQIDYYVKDHS
ncbi:MAG: tRNA (cytidine/uridine-2'-O-)-methyltransferase TrmJ [Verrucomicrobiae bacterium]|nr:tRNA (cytidine/uridine-2'-O-)-methyltransferase TrmJ [Verrucomicrobiae bacterium]